MANTEKVIEATAAGTTGSLSMVAQSPKLGLEGHPKKPEYWLATSFL